MSTKEKKQAKSTEPEVQAQAEEQTKAMTAPEQTTTALAQMDVDYASDAEQFVDDYNRDDFAIPFLQVLQTNSPQVAEDDPAHIEGAKPGFMLNTLTKEVYDTIKGQILLVPAHYRKTFVEWVIREAGGGFVKDHGLEAGLALLQQCVKDDKGRMIVPSSDPQAKPHQLVETMQFSVVSVSKSGNIQPCLFPLTSTQLKKGRKWNSDIDSLRIPHPKVKNSMLRPPMFYMAYAVKTVREENDKGKWYGVEIIPYAPTLEAFEDGKSVYFAARTLRESVESGAVSMEKSATAEEAAGNTIEGSSEQAPF